MPVIDTTNAEGERVKRYKWPADLFEWTEDMAGIVRGIRVDASRLLGEVSGIKELKREQLRIQKAATLAIEAIETHVGPLRSDLWPIELSTELDWIASRMEAARG